MGKTAIIPAVMECLHLHFFPKIAAVALLPAVCTAGIITRTVDFSADEVRFEKTAGGLDLVSLPDAVGSGSAGTPQIPSVLLHFVIPANAILEKVEITEQRDKTLPGTYTIAPVQEAVPFSHLSKRRVAAPNAAIYSSSSLYPARSFEPLPAGSMCGFRIAALRYYPLRYLPREGTLHLTTHARLHVQYTTSAGREVTSLSKRQYDEFKPFVEKLVCNPGECRLYKPAVRENGADDVNYAIITDLSLAPGFEPLKKWKTKKGFKADIFTTESIFGKYSGHDKAEKIRNFLKEYFKNKGLIYVLLAGDSDKIPERDLKLAAFGTQPHDGMLASDLYYADMDGSWDENNNHVYGERTEDKIDGNADIFVGRAPVDKPEDVQTFIHKDTVAEKHPPAANQKKYFLYSVPVGTTGHLKELNDILRDSTPPGWTVANVEYDNGKNKTAIFDSLTKGVSLCHIASHGAFDEFVTDAGSVFTLDEVARLANGNNLPVLFSMACHVGCYDHPSVESIGEMLLKKAGGGCVAALLNSREGLGDVDLSTMKIIVGFSERLCVEFNSNFFIRDMHVVGKNHAAVQNKFAALAWDSVNIPGVGGDAQHYEKWAWAVSEWTLFGDPDLPMFEESPTALSASHPKSVAPGQQNFTVTISGRNAPVADAYICCWKDGEVYATGKTNASGQAVLPIQPSSNGVMHVTATARNHLPYEGTCGIGEVVVSKENAAVGHQFSRCSIRGNPNGEYSARFHLARRSDVTIRLFRADGSLWKRAILRNCPTGPNVFSMGHPARGITVVRFTAGDFQTTAAIVIVN